jgi:two-component system phosphate regulon sensor histidine kinase PhoR
MEMDSNDMMLLNRDFLYRIIKEALAEEKIFSSFDFALYNAYTANFVVSPMLVEKEIILQSEYLFKLKNNDKFIAPHYLILYFPSERSIFFQRMSTIVILIVCFIILIVLICGGTLTALYRQKRAADVKNDFINNMTHEFKTPISTISLACEAIGDKSVNDLDAKMTYVSIIKDENVRLQKMVENILLTAQLNKGQLRMNVELVDVRALIEKVLNSLSLQVISRGGKISAKLNAEEHNIFADPVHIENIIVNLLENALKYSPGRPFIEIRTRNEGKNLIIEVEDHGIGIAKKEIKRIFNEFYRVSQGNRHDTKGFGLGLGYVKKIVSLHHGNVSVKSEPGKGSTFIVSLPIKM